ncbi:MAG TPA: hypothetical protein VHG52_08095, partial [Thermomicrobiales bacterium]|nr:hypothetical protein [Thermomicrobiales bacterium]
PVLCRDLFVGVVELAGSIRGDLERTLDQLSPDLTAFGERLTHDPALRSPQLLDMDVECSISGGFWSKGDIEMTADEWMVLSAIGSRGTLRDVSRSVPLPEERLIDVTRGLVARGIASARATTRVLVEDRERHELAATIAADGGS